MKEKIVFFDIDGTLVDEEKKIPASTVKAIRALQEAKIHVAIATGRPPFMYEELRQELKIENFISFSGQHAVVNQEVIYDESIDRGSLLALHEAALRAEFPMIFMSGEKMFASMADHPQVIEALDRLKFPYPAVDLTFPEREKIYQALLFCEADQGAIIKEDYPLHFLRWHQYAIDIMPKGGSKAKGVRAVLEKLNIDAKNAYAIGDGMNDLEMFHTVGTGIAMGNSVEPLLKLADYVTDRVEADGVYKALKKLKLIP